MSSFASLAVAVVLPEPCRPAIRITVGGRGEKLSPAEAPPISEVSSSLTILTTCWPGLSFSPRPPTVILMAGLQGSGKTTATAKLDGAAALSVKAVTGKPIMYASTGEKLGDFEKFHPDRMAQRILGMGDVLSFIEKAEQQVDADDAKELERKLRKNQFTLEDFLKQLKTIRRMGPLSNLLGMLPGVAGQQAKGLKVDEKEFDRVEAIILSMTPYERRHPDLIKGSRRLRIAKGSGTNVQQVNHLVKQFGQMRKLMAQLAKGKMPDPQQLMRGM